MICKILSYILMTAGILAMAVGGVLSYNDPFEDYALYYLMPGYLVMTIGICCWLRRYFKLPNLLTISRILLVPLILLLLLPGMENRVTSFFAFCLFVVASLTDMIDGWLARRLKIVSTIGKFLDPLADKLIYLTLLVAFTPSGIVPMWLVMIVLIRELFITGLRTVAAGEGMVIAASWGGKLKTIFALVGMSFLLIYHTYPVDFLFFTVRINFHYMGMLLTYVSLIFCITSALEYTYRVVKKLTFDTDVVVAEPATAVTETEPADESK